MAKKRANGEGSIRKKPSGRWEGRYTQGIDPVTGRAIQKSVSAKTQAECKEKLAKAIRENRGRMDTPHEGVGQGLVVLFRPTGHPAVFFQVVIHSLDVDGRELFKLDRTDGRDDVVLDDPLIALGGVVADVGLPSCGVSMRCCRRR